MRQIAKIAVVVWTALGAPVLCMGGFLAHPCDCGDTSNKAHAHCDEEEAPTSCDHESGCALDPCEEMTASRDELTQTLKFSLMPQLQAATCLADALLPKPSPTGSPPEDTANRLRLPLHQSDLPLLL